MEEEEEMQKKPKITLACRHNFVWVASSVDTLFSISNDLPHLCMTAEKEEGEEVEIIEVSWNTEVPRCVCVRVLNRGLLIDSWPKAQFFSFFSIAILISFSHQNSKIAYRNHKIT